MAAATVAVKELNGTAGSQTYTTCSSTASSYFRVSDAHGSSTPSYKIPIPSSGQNYSYWKSYIAEVSANGDSNTLDNWNFYLNDYSSWTSKLGSSGAVKAGQTSGGSYGISIGSYVQAVGQSDSNGWAGKELTADHTWISSVAAAPTSASEYDNRSITSTGSTNYFTLQIHVDTDATFGELGELTAHIQYDES